ncbi:MAG: putative copper-exporting P-type ATPase A [Methanosaeta sp. PtaU1.Bin060]|nr:MAG: putative copper-exporting P-type ATPase A [Methanosaeta sp. PtaU1.Bin060]
MGFEGDPLQAENFDISTAKGLSEADAARLLREVGHNELPSSKPRSVFAIAFEVAREPMFLLLVAGGIVYMMLGDLQEALMLLGFVFVVMGITLYQERKTERALEALRDLSSPRAMVIRDGAERRIAGRDVVPGDLVILSEGDRVPADSILLACTNLSADESLLTGESISVRKVCSEDAEGMREIARPGGDDLPFVYSGSLVVQGQGVAMVKATGINTEIGKIGRALQKVEPEETALQKETNRLVRDLAILGLSLCLIVVIAFGMTRDSWLQGILAGITMAMAVLPEEFPVVLTVFLALGAWRISQNSVLTRRMPAVETLGSATVLCVDKTGTLTLNRMNVRRIFANGKFFDLDGAKGSLPEDVHEVVEFSILASQIDPFDPMEKAFKKLGDEYLARTEHIHRDWELVKEYPLSRKLLTMSRVWRSQSRREYVIAAKGAPEAIEDLCHLDPARQDEISEAIQAMGREGMRVLGVAAAIFREADLPEGQHDFDFRFLGLIGMEDPVRPGVPEAVRECHCAGIRVVMITGDYPGTAQAIGRQIGLPSERVVTGPELEKMSDLELQARVRDVCIFSRMVPEQKLRLVRALEAAGEIVAMTGDGVNDAPALKAADIGIAMGGRGTDVAREAASLVLLDDDFSSIVRAVRLGRRIYDNLKKAMAYILAIHVPIAGMSLIPVLLDWPLIFFPVQVVFLELIIDPTCSVAFEAEPEEADVMKRPPRDPERPLFSKHMLGLSVLQGLMVLVIVLAVYALSIYRGQGEAEARALTYTTLIAANLGLILTNRSWSRTIMDTLSTPNPALWWVMGGALVFLAAVLYNPFLRELFGFAYLHPIDIAICFMAGTTSILWFEGLKMATGRVE